MDDYGFESTRCDVTGKRRYRNRKIATEAMESIRAAGTDMKKPQRLNVYFCVHCHGFHVGHRPH